MPRHGPRRGPGDSRITVFLKEKRDPRIRCARFFTCMVRRREGTGHTSCHEPRAPPHQDFARQARAAACVFYLPSFSSPKAYQRRAPEDRRRPCPGPIITAPVFGWVAVGTSKFWPGPCVPAGRFLGPWLLFESRGVKWCRGRWRADPHTCV